METEERGRVAWLWHMFKYYLRTAWLRYKKLHIGGKVRSSLFVANDPCRQLYCSSF